MGCADPFLIEGPALISFSGGRTSGYLLHRILERGLQPDVHVVFCNTGKEDDRTLDFVRECGERWRIRVRWLEYRRQFLPRYRSPDAERRAWRIRNALQLHMQAPPPDVAARRLEPGFVEVSYDTAARTTDPPSLTHPFTNLLCATGLPNATTRLCTTELKIRVMKRFMIGQGYDAWSSVVGIRADEPRRVARMRVKPPERWENELPLDDAGITEADVLDFWRQQPFDLALPADPELGTYGGNCDLCHLKSDGKKVRLARERPEVLDWWERMEEAAGQTFRPRLPVREVRRLSLVPAQRAPALDNELTDLGDCICHE